MPELGEVPLPVLAVAPDGALVECSTAFLRLVGRATAPDRVQSLFPVEEHPLVAGVLEGDSDEQVVAGLRDEGFPYRIQLIRCTPEDGGAVLLLARTAPPPLVPVSQADQLPPPTKGPVDGAVSHDVRGALRGVSGFLSLLEREIELNDEAAGYLETIRRSASTADEMSRALVDWMRLLLTPLVLQPLDLGVVVADAADRAAAIAVEQADALPHPGDLHLDVAGLPSVLGDRGLLLATFTELLVNAGRFSEGDVTVRITAEAADGWCRVRVADDGPGIEARLAEDAFMLFRLLQPKGQYPGIGMGLALSRRRVEVQGGRLWIEETDAPGTTVVARLASG